MDLQLEISKFLMMMMVDFPLYKTWYNFYIIIFVFRFLLLLNFMLLNIFLTLLLKYLLLNITYSGAGLSSTPESDSFVCKGTHWYVYFSQPSCEEKYRLYVYQRVPLQTTETPSGSPLKPASDLQDSSHIGFQFFFWTQNRNLNLKNSSLNKQWS